MNYILKTWDDKAAESNEVALYCTTKDEAIHDAVVYKQAHENLEVSLWEMDNKDSFSRRRVLKVELTNEQKLASFWNGSISGQLKNKQVRQAPLPKSHCYCDYSYHPEGC